MAVKVAEEYGGFISVDSFRPKPSELALAEGADILNVQYPYEPGILELCAKDQAGLVIMHHEDVEGSVLIDKVANFLLQKAADAETAGLNRQCICIDPGFGFGKSIEGNYYILQYLSELCSLDYPLLAGLSRKRMIGAALDTTVENRQAGTLAAEMCAALAGALIIRTHDVKACADGLKVLACADGLKVLACAGGI
jgi:dihydropteroate synthase